MCNQSWCKMNKNGKECIKHLSPKDSKCGVKENITINNGSYLAKRYIKGDVFDVVL